MKTLNKEHGFSRDQCDLLYRTVLLNPLIPWVPTVKQALFLINPEKEVLFGGSAGGGKSLALIMSALQYANMPNYNGILFRKSATSKGIENLMRTAREALKDKAKWKQQNRTWYFEEGGQLSFAYLNHENDFENYQGDEYHFIGFDELCEFTENNYTKLFTRLRSSNSSIPLRVRATCNPGADWVRDRFGIYNNNEPIIETPWEITTVNRRLTGKRVFIRSSLRDNPYIKYTEYMESFANVSEDIKDRFLHGKWDTLPDRFLQGEEIRQCMSNTSWTLPQYDQQAELFLGIDVGIKDLFVIWTLERLDNVLITREVFAKTGLTFSKMRKEIEDRMTASVIKCNIDKGGIGYSFADDLVKTYPRQIVGVMTGETSLAKYANQMKILMQENKLRLPDDRQVFNDFSSVRTAYLTSEGIMKLKLDKDKKSHMHHDRFVACCLACDAAYKFMNRNEKTSIPLPQVVKSVMVPSVNILPPRFNPLSLKRRYS
ncbi:MAG: terminase family protein [Candidatus Obscuribacterales bacterium]|nr:terminase family protein [Candidatus Obscuribacterales bacterium]